MTIPIWFIVSQSIVLGFTFGMWQENLQAGVFVLILSMWIMNIVNLKK